MDYSKIFTVEPGKRSGNPCIRGMRDPCPTFRSAWHTA